MKKILIVLVSVFLVTSLFSGCNNTMPDEEKSKGTEIEADFQEPVIDSTQTHNSDSNDDFSKVSITEYIDSLNALIKTSLKERQDEYIENNTYTSEFIDTMPYFDINKLEKKHGAYVYEHGVFQISFGLDETENIDWVLVVCTKKANEMSDTEFEAFAYLAGCIIQIITSRLTDRVLLENDFYDISNEAIIESNGYEISTSCYQVPVLIYIEWNEYEATQ